MTVNISNGFNFSDVYRIVNYIRSLASYINPFGGYSLCARPNVEYTLIDLRKSNKPYNEDVTCQHTSLFEFNIYSYHSVVFS